RVPWFGPVRTRPGARSSRVHLLDLPDAVQRDDATRRAFETWEWFSAGWVTNTGDDPHVVGDLRYSLTIAGADPLWSMRLQPGEQPPVVRVDASRRADPGKYARRLWRNLLYGEHD